MDYICRSFETAIQSLSMFANCSETKLYNALMDNWEDKYDNMDESFGAYLFNAISLNKGLCNNHPTIHWFHATRCSEPSEFWRSGILPTEDMINSVVLTADVIAKQIGVCKQVHDMKDIRLQERRKCSNGPYGFLLYEDIVSSENCAFFSEGSEFMRAYVQVTYPDDVNTIIDIFKQQTVPTIVEFTAFSNISDSMFNIVCSTLEYLYCKIHNKKPWGTTHSNDGIVVSSSQIVDIRLYHDLK